MDAAKPFVPYLSVTIREKTANREAVAGRPTRVGLYVATPDPKAERQVVQIVLNFADGARPMVMAHVARCVKPEAATENEPAGMELRFFSMPEADRERYNRLVEAVAAGRQQPLANPTGGRPSSLAPAIATPLSPAAGSGPGGATSGVKMPLPGAGGGAAMGGTPSGVKLPLSPAAGSVPMGGTPSGGRVPLPPGARPPTAVPGAAGRPMTFPPAPPVGGGRPASLTPGGVAGLSAPTATHSQGAAPLDIRWAEEKERAKTQQDAFAAARAFPRRETSFRVRLKDMVGNDREDATRDVSLGGMFLKTTETKPVGERFSVEVVHPFTGVRFALWCTVRRVENGPDGKPTGMGVQFDPLDPAARERFTLFTYGGYDLPIQSGETAMEGALRRVQELDAELADNPVQADKHYALGLLHLFMMDMPKARAHLEIAKSLGYIVIRDVWQRLEEEEQAMADRIDPTAE